MPSPFPGMDPYLESAAIWSDLHLTLIVIMRAELNAHLPRGYLAAADRHVWIEDAEEEVHRIVGPDVFVVDTPTLTGGLPVDESATALMPRSVTLPLRERKGTPYLKILDAQDRRVVTVVELLSPSNKSAGDDRNAYLAKREEYLAANVNLVEINLLRAGKLPPLGKPRLAKGSYYYLVCRADEVPHGKLWSFTVRDPLPLVPIPLRNGEFTMLDPRKCLDRAYGEARYGEEINYALPPEPKLNSDDALWAQSLLKRMHQ
jgi:Uma2 family endonuclease